METIQVNKITYWFQTTQIKTYINESHKYKSISSLKQETYKVPTKHKTPPKYEYPIKNMARAKNIKYKVKHLDTI